MSRAFACILLSLGTAAAVQTCPLTFVGTVKQFVVEQENGKNRRKVPAVESNKTPKEFYDFNSWSSHTGFEKARVSNMFLYRDLNNPTHLSFFWTHGIDHPHGNQPSASVDGLVSGVPDGVTIAERDDRAAEWDWTTSSSLGSINHNKGIGAPFNVGGRWRFAKNTDGGAIEGLPTNLNWELKVQTRFNYGIDTWQFHFGDGSVAQDMDPSEPVYLRPVLTSVDTGVAPYPQTPGKETFCTLVKSDIDGEQLTFTFSWGDDTPDTVVTKTEGNLACAEHDFCGPVSATCGGTAPRKVRVFAKGSGCTPVHKILADEEIDTCPPLNFVGDVKQFVVEQENGKNRRTVPAVEQAMTAKQFYDFRSVSAHTGFEKAKTSNMFLYRDLTNPTHLSFFWIHGIDSPPGSQPVSDVDALITGIPGGVSIAQSDDRTAEWDWTTSNTVGVINHQKAASPPLSVGGHWWFHQNTDGGALDGFPTNLNWEIKIQANFIRGIDTWSFHFGDGSLQQDMDMSEPVYLRPVVTSVDLGVAPYPQVAGPETFCTLVESITQQQLTYTFKWGDNTPDTVVTGPAGHVTCASHNFCGVASATCGGTVPRKVRVFVKKTGCNEVGWLLADERVDDVTCGNHEGVKVSIDKNLLTGHNVNGMDFSNNNAVLTRIPENMRDMQVHTPGTIPKGTAMTLTCCGSKNCEFIVSHYHCPPCSKKENGGFPALLPLSGFESASCAPRWGSTEQRMVSYRIRLDAGASLVLPETTEEASSFVIFSKFGELDDPWCPKPTRSGCGGPCPPTVCTCEK